MSVIERECPTCEGSGAVYMDDGEGGTDSERCDTCAGDGRIVPASDYQGAVEALRDVRKIAADTGRDGDQACGEIVARVTLALDAIGGQ
jgi:DnaJ-class molecular chaperone